MGSGLMLFICRAPSTSISIQTFFIFSISSSCDFLLKLCGLLSSCITHFLFTYFYPHTNKVPCLSLLVPSSKETYCETFYETYYVRGKCDPAQLVHSPPLSTMMLLSFIISPYYATFHYLLVLQIIQVDFFLPPHGFWPPAFSYWSHAHLGHLSQETFQNTFISLATSCSGQSKTSHAIF